MEIEERLSKLGIQLPKAPLPAGNYQPAVKIGQLLFLSGAICCVDGIITHSGKIGAPRDIAYGKAAARVCALNLLASAQQALGDLDQIKLVVQLSGFVNAIPSFSESPAIINGASDLFIEVFGEQGRHTRAAVAVTGLPKDSTVEIQAIFATK